MKLQDRVVVVTGSSSGIGAALAEAFAGEGADVVVCYRANREGGETTARAVRQAGRDALVVQVDVARDVRLLG